MASFDQIRRQNNKARNKAVSLLLLTTILSSVSVVGIPKILNVENGDSFYLILLEQQSAIAQESGSDDRVTELSPSSPSGVVDDITSGVDDTVGSIRDVIDQVLGTINTRLEQINETRDDVVGAVGDVVGPVLETIRNVLDLRAEIEGIIGDLSSIDMGDLLDDLWSDILEPGALEAGEEPISDPINGINATVYIETTANALEIEASRLESDRVLSEESQEAMANQLSRMQDVVGSSLELAQGSATLSSNSAELFSEVASAATDSQSAATESESLSETAQSAVSTQDVVKNLTAVASQVSSQLSSSSSQLSGLSSQSVTQSGQLANIGQQLANQTELDALMLSSINQTNIGVAVMQRNIASMQELDAGEYQSERIQESLVNNRTGQLISQGYRTFR